jgi:hypothetical protein
MDLVVTTAGEILDLHEMGRKQRLGGAESATHTGEVKIGDPSCFYQPAGETEIEEISRIERYRNSMQKHALFTSA